jgi:hypothetical protein
VRLAVAVTVTLATLCSTSWSNAASTLRAVEGTHWRKGLPIIELFAPGRCRVPGVARDRIRPGALRMPQGRAATCSSTATPQALTGASTVFSFITGQCLDEEPSTVFSCSGRFQSPLGVLPRDVGSVNVMTRWSR